MLALTLANLKMMARNRQTTFWALLFPLILVATFGLFDFTSPADSNLAVIDLADSPASRQLVGALGEVDLLRLQEPPASPEEGRSLIRAGELDFLMVIPPGFVASKSEAGPGPATPTAGTGKAIEPVTLILGSGNEDRNMLVIGLVQQISDSVVLGPAADGVPETLTTERVIASAAPYFDLVLLGLVGVGIMTHSIISIAVHISNYRNLSILKRLMVTPLAIWKFFAAEVTAQLILAVIQAIVIISIGVLVFNAQINGNVLHMLPVIVLGSLVFLNIGFIISAWANSPAAASGLGNVVAFPMMFFAGAFFPTTTLPWLLPYAAEALPLAPMITALREIGIQGAALWDVWPELAWLVGWVAATTLIAVRVFRFS